MELLLVEELVALAEPLLLVFVLEANSTEHLPEYHNGVLAVRVADSFPELLQLAVAVRLPVVVLALVVVLVAAVAAHLQASALLQELRLDL